MSAAPRNGKIVTFYSYKGGTGRSMALANVGWILASAGHRVLLIDWDFEAPGLHRYMAPFLSSDPERATSAGLIDFFVDFASSARVAHAGGTKDARWFESCASLVRYASPVEWDFGDGALELVAAGRQDAGYGVAVTSFNWQDFYEKLGGGVFLEALKRKLRHDYDFVLIDSRTGISDTSGIGTVQMPDELVVLFTLNRQSMKGAQAIARSAHEQRRTSNGLPGLRIWPVPTRIEEGEKDRVDAAREEYREMFDWFIGRAMPSRTERRRYWGRVEVRYRPYYAFEEVLSVFGDPPFQDTSMLADMESLAGLLTLPEVLPSTLPERPRMRSIPERLRLETKARFERPKKSAPAPVHDTHVFVSYSKDDRAAADAIVEELKAAGIATWIDYQDLRYGSDISAETNAALKRSGAVLFLVGKGALGDWRRDEYERARAAVKPVIPVLVGGADYAALPLALQRFQAARIAPKGQKSFDEDVARLARDVRSLLEDRSSRSASPFDEDDPQKGRWGGLASRAGRELTATVTPIATDYFEITLEVRGTTEPLTGTVEFHLHPTFPKSTETAIAENNRAVLKLLAYGAFTVGAVADGGRTSLELDLAENPSFPELFRAR